MEQSLIRFEDKKLAQSMTFELTALHMAVPVQYDEWERGYTSFKQVEGCGPWWIGDYLKHGERMYGERYSQALDEEHAKTHLVYKYVCSRIEPARRREKLSFSVHREVAPLEPPVQDKILDVAERDSLTVRDVRELVKATNGEAKKATDWLAKFKKMLFDMDGATENTDQYYATIEQMRDHLQSILDNAGDNWAGMHH